MALWIAQALAFFPAAREAAQSRYQYVAAALVLLAAAALADGWRPTRRTGAALAVVTAAVVVSNAHLLHEREAFWAENSEYVAAETGAIEIARDVVEPGFLPEDAVHRRRRSASTTCRSPPARTCPPPPSTARSPTAHGSSRAGPRPSGRRPTPCSRTPSASICSRLARRAAAPPPRSPPVPGTALAASGVLELRRFADGYRFVRFAGTGRVELPRDRAALPWSARVSCP